MLAARCPGCGAACPVSVHETETLHCDQCGHTGPHAAEVRTGLQKAAEVLGSLDVRQRQLTDGQRKRVHQARIGNIAALVILVTIFLPLIPTVLVLSVVFFFETGGLQGDAVWVPLSFSCLFLSIPLSAFVAYGWYRHRQKKLIRACVAVPPPVQGQPARCRVCGAGLPEAQEGEVAVVRCEYCSADNLVDPATMQRLGARHARVLQRHEQEIRRNATVLTSDPRMGGYLVGLAPIGVAMVGTIVIVIVGVLTSLGPVERDAIERREYVAVTGLPHGTCLGMYSGSEEYGGFLTLDELMEEEGPHGPGLSTRFGSAPVDLPTPALWTLELAGKTCRCAGDDRVGEIDVLYSLNERSGGGWNWVRIRTHAGGTVTCPLLQVCFDEVPDDLPVVPWSK